MVLSVFERSKTKIAPPNRPTGCFCILKTHHKRLSLLKTTMKTRCEIGVTVIELVLVCCIISTLAYIALQRIGEFKSSMDRFNARVYLAQDLRRAQAHTLSEGCRGIFVIATTGKEYSFGCDYLNYDTNSSPVPDVYLFRRDLPSGVKLTANKKVFFNSRGESVDIDGIIDSVTISLSDTRFGTERVFSSGSLLGTGLYKVD